MKPKKSLFSRGGHAAAFVIAVTFSVAGQSFAAEYDWNAATADFSNAANWSIGGTPAPGAPGNTDSANVANGGNAQWTTNAAKTILELRAGNGAAGTVSISGGNAFTSSNGALVGRQNGATIGTLNVSGAGTIFNVTTGNTHVGTVSHSFGTAGAGATGVLNISAGAVFNHNPSGDESFIIGNNLPPANTPVQAGTYKGTLNVNNATLNVLNGSRLYIGQSPGSVGEVNVTNNGAISVTDDWLIVGRSGQGKLTLSSGTITKAGGNNFAVGDLAGTGVVEHTGGTINVNGGEFWVGQGGGTTGTYTLGAGAVLNTNFWTTVGRGGGTGTFNLNGGTITKNGAGEFMVGAYDGGPSNGTFNQNSGTVDVVSGQLWIGQGSNYINNESPDTLRATGTYNLDGGSVNVNNWVAVGRERGVGTMNISGTGKLTKTGNNDNHFVIGQGNTALSSGTLTVTEDGLLDIKAGQLWVSENTAGSATLSGNGRINAPAVQVARFASPGDGGVLNLNGGTLQTGRIFGGAGTSAVNFGGTTIVATANENFFIENLDTATIQTAAGLKIDSNGFNLVVGGTRPSPNDNPYIPPQVLTGPGGITKSGLGTLTLAGSHSYKGPTVINGGRLVTGTFAVPGDGTTGAITIAADASLSLNLLDYGQSIAPAAFSLNQGTISFNLGNTPDTDTPPIDVGGTLTLNGTAGTSVINIATTSNNFSNMSPGTDIPLIRYTGNIAGSAGFASLKVGTLPIGMKGVLVNDTNSKTIKLDITRLAIPAWTGAVSNVWDLAAANWENSVGDGVGTTYLNGDPVLFPDRANAALTVQLPGTVTPGAYVLFNNSGTSYTLAGGGKISGTTQLIKRGTGSVTLNTTGNDFTGGVLIEGGSVVVGSLPNGGAASAIGSASAAPANLVLAGGSLNYTGGNTTSNRGFTVGGAGGGISVTNAATNLTLSGTNASTAGGLVKKGAGTLTLTGSGVIGSSAPVEVQAGKLALNGTGTNPAQAVTAGEIWVGNTPEAPGSLDLTAGTLSTSNWMAIGRGNGNSGHVSSLNVSNATLNVPNFSTGYAPDGVPNLATQNVTFSGTAKVNNTGATQIAETRGSTTNITISGSSELTTRELRVAMGGGAKEGATAATITLQENSVWNLGTQANTAFASFGFNGGTGNLILKDNAQFTHYDDFSLAEAGSSTGNLTIQDNAKLTTGLALLGRGDQGNALITQTGGTFSNSGDKNFQIGVNGDAIFNLSGGAVNAYGYMAVARYALSTSSLNISGGTFTQMAGDRNAIVGEVGNGTVDVSGSGTFQANGILHVGLEGAGVGTIKQTGGTINVGLNVIVGQQGTGLLNLSGGQLSMNSTGGRDFIVGNTGSGRGTVNISGNANVRLLNNASFILGNEATNADANSLVNQTGGTVTFYSDNGTAVGGTGVLILGRDAPGTPEVPIAPAKGNYVYKLGGGTLVTSAVTRSSPDGSGVLQFDGGTLKATANNAAFVSNLSNVEVLGGGAIIDSNSFNVTVVNGLSAGAGTGGLTKTGAGTLTLAGVSTYAGNTVISAGGVTLADNAQLRFLLGGNGVNNSITGTGTATLNGDFLIQNVAGSIGNGNSWTLVAGSVNKSYGASFNVIGYTESNNVWTKVDGGNTWTFSEATGVLTLTTGGVSDPYTTWTNTYFPGVTDQAIIGRNADPDRDGNSNALEFALGGAPNNGADNAKVYSIQADSSDAGTEKELLLTIAVRAGTPLFTPGTSPTATKDGVTYTIQGSLDLTGFNTGVTEVDVVPPAAPQNPPNGYEYRTFSLNGSNNLTGKGFIRVRVN